jgi:hypothetical protein
MDSTAHRESRIQVMAKATALKVGAAGAVVSPGQPTNGDTTASPAPSDTLQTFTLDDLAQYTNEGAFGPTASPDFRVFYVGRDDVHGVLMHLRGCGDGLAGDDLLDGPHQVCVLVDADGDVSTTGPVNGVAAVAQTTSELLSRPVVANSDQPVGGFRGQ